MTSFTCAVKMERILLLLLFGFMSWSVKAQGIAEVWTDKEVYAEGETISLTIRVTNNEPQAYTWVTDCNLPTVMFGAVDLSYDVCVAFEEPFHFLPNAWRSWTFNLRPHELGLPSSSGEHRIIARFAHLSDSVVVEAPRYVGGQVRATIPDGANPDSVASIKADLNATVLWSLPATGETDEVWEIVGTDIEDAAARFQGPHVALEPYRVIGEVSSVGADERPVDISVNVDVYPNPFRTNTNLRLEMSQTEHVGIEIYDVIGRRVAVLHDGQLVGGQTHLFTFTPEVLWSGRYYYRVASRSHVFSGMLVFAP